MLYYSVRYLHRHPAELELTIEQMHDVIAVGNFLDDEKAKTIQMFAELIAKRGI